MAYFQSAVRSQVLGMDVSVNFVVPYDRYDAEGNPGRYDKVLYLLHGLKGSAFSWPRMSSCERYANYYGYALVIPEVQRSFYANMEYGPDYFTYITEELPKIAQGIFKLPEGRENTYIGGLSMGGYGALKCALTRPDLYAGAMCFSSGFYAMERPDMLMKRYYSQGELQGIMGMDLKIRDENNIDYLMQHFPENAQKPRLYLACGTEDFLYETNVRAHNSLQKCGFAHTWEEWSGTHDWKFWDVALERAMRQFDNKE